MVFIEPTFPRGKKAEESEDVPRRKFQKNNYGASTAEDAKARKPRPKERRQALLEQKMDEEGNRELTANNLSFFTLQEGMLVMGCVTFLSRDEIGLNIPGRIKGVVPVSSVSNAYTKRLQAGSCDCPDLWHMYKVGDVVYAKVMKKQIPDRHLIELSLNPTDLHSEFDAKKLVPGLVLAATIAEEEDHGFLMETGIRNVFAFLPRANLRNNVADIGRNIFCFIEKVRPVDGKSVRLVLKAFRTTEQRRLNVGEANLDMVVPGCVIPFTVDKVLDHGLRGTLFDDDVPAFAYENMLTTTTSKPSDYSLFKRMDATLLYVLPVTKQVYVSLVHYKKNFIEGQVLDPPTIEKAITERATLNGVWFSFGNCRAYMPKRMVVQALGSGENYEDFIKFGKYSIGSEHKLNIIRYDHLDRTFIVSARPDDTEEELKSLNEVCFGKTYRCEVVKSTDANAGIEVKLGQVAGLVKGVYLQRGRPLRKGFQLTMKAVELSADGTTVLFTNRPRLLDKKVKVLSDWKQLSPATRTEDQFDGIVVDETAKHFVVAFFGGITGLVEKKVDDDTSAGAPLVDSFKLARGTIARFTVEQYDEGKKRLLLSVPEKEMKVSPGTVTAVTVTSVCPNAVFVETAEGEEKGKIPLDFFSVFPEHNAAFVRLLREGQELQAVKLWANVLSVRDVQYAQRSPMFSELVKPGDVLRANTVPHHATACPLLCDYRKNVPLPSDWAAKQSPSREVLMVKVKDILTTTGRAVELDLSFKPEDVCSGGIESVFSYVVDYFDDVIDLIKRSAEKSMAFAKYNIGQAVSCTVESVLGDKVVVKVCDAEGENITNGIGTKSKRMTPNAGDKLDGRIVWVDVERQLVHVCIDPKLLRTIGDPETAASIPEAQSISADQTESCTVLFKNKYIRICSLQSKSPGPLLVVPVRHHYNDLEGSPQEDEKSSVIDVVKIRRFGPLVFGMLEEPYKLYSSYAKKNSKKIKTATLKRKKATEETDGQGQSQENGTKIKANGKKRLAKLQQNDEEKPKKKKVKQIESLNAEKPANVKAGKKTSVVKNGKRKSDAASNGEATGSLGKKKKGSFAIEQLDGCDDGLFLLQLDGADAQLPSKKKASKRKLDPEPKGSKGGLPGATNFWDSTPVYKQAQADSSDGEEEHSGAEEQEHAAVGAKKRLTAKERFEALKQEEDRLRKIEEELADPSIDPHTPDQFDRLVLAQPNNSMLWIRYMVFHMESAELDKARAVARKALKAINFREEAELLNVWVALLNLEIRYETVDSFKEVLQEAIQYSDAFKVYTRVLDILIDCEKTTEVRELLELLQKKFRKQPEMWYLVADAWYRIGQGSKVKPLLSQALKSLPNRDHIPLIVKFAFLHNRNANRDEAHLLFEQILTSYPKRTDIWSQYVDMLVKDGLVENARQILERAIMQRLPMKNMKTLYTKYVNFEEKHGDRDTVRRVKQKATEYVQTQLNNAGISSIADSSSGRKK